MPSAPQTSYTTDQWLRKISLIVVDSTLTNGLDLSQFRIRFQTRQADPSSAKPNTAWIRIYNLKPETTAGIIKEYTSVVLQAGYQTGKFGIIFQGTIKQFKTGHESVTDSYFDLLAADGDLAHNFAVTLKALPKGWSSGDWVKSGTDPMAQYNVSTGYDGIAGGTGGLLPGAFRGAMMVGMSRDVTSDATANAGATWMIVNGVVQVVPLVGYLPGEAVVLNFKTGLIGWPEATESGLYARCLLNPAIKCQGQVQINNAAINQTIVNPNTSGGLGGFVGPGSAFPDANLQGFATVTNDGFYRVLVVEHEGDTRGQPWYTNLVCLALDTSAPGGGQTTDQTTTVPAGSETIESINITTPTS